MSELIHSLWQHPIVELLGWTLVHFLWQGFVLAIPLAVGLWLLRSSSALARYSLACGGLALLAILPIVTLSVLVSRVDSRSWQTVKPEPQQANAISAGAIEDQTSRDASSTVAPLDSSQDTALTDRASTKIQSEADIEAYGAATTWWSGDSFERWMPTIASIWIVGVTLLSLRLLGGLWRVQQLRRRSRVVVDERLNRIVDELVRRMKLRGSLQLLQSAEWSVPVVIGFWRPALIVPLSLLSGLTVSEVESLLAHELAHVRRQDWIVNLGQSLIETLLFYHPVVWWVSAMIRRERENCCDDVAMAVCGDRLALAKALVHLEEQRCGAGALALSATGGSLVQRIRRIALSQEHCPTARWSAGWLTLATAMLLIGGLWVSVVTATRSVQAAEEATNMEVASSLEQETNAAPQVRDKDWPKQASEVARTEPAALPLGPVSPDAEPRPTEVNTDADETPWGRMAERSGLQSRLTLQTEKPQVGQPLLVKLELRNSGDQPAEFDPQNYAPFRVLRVDVPRPDLPPPFIGMRPQTFGQNVTLQPGEVRTLWENVDVAELFLLAQDRVYEVYSEGGEWAMQPIWRDSNHLSIQLQNGPLPARQKLIAALLEILPDEWTISVGFGEIHLQHSPTNLKKDVTSLSVRYGPEKLADDLSIGWPVPGQEKVFANVTVVALGETELGHLYLLGLPSHTEKVWPGYLEAIKRAIASTRKAPDPKQPWQATGRVTDRDGNPLAGVTVNAHCGIGSLKRTGSTVTDLDGRYDLKFGPGFLSNDGHLLQVATISVSLDGHVEQNLHRQGDCLAAMAKPDGDDLDWGGKTVDDLVLPGVTKEINFVMVPAARLRGSIRDAKGDLLDGVRVSLIGDSLPPSSSVVAQTRTDKGGRFELTDIPPGYAWQLLIEPAKAQSPWLAWASPLMEFQADAAGRTQIRAAQEIEAVEYNVEQLSIIILGTGTTAKQAAMEAKEHALILTATDPAATDLAENAFFVLEIGG